MCGITGIWNLDGAAVDLAALERMTTALRHRGPDDEGYLLVNVRKQTAFPARGRESHPALQVPELGASAPGHDLAFGHRRLAIIDLSPAGHGPMCYADGGLWITYNGEVYNYRELRAELAGQGYAFRTETDTEVVLAAYRAWGVECLQRFNGMFAFALWDRAARQLFCARDRLGVKPFYYRRDGSAFAFASEPQALTHYRAAPPNGNAIYDYLAWADLDHNHETFFEGVRQLPPGHFALVELDNFALRRWWHPPEEAGDALSEADAVAEFGALLEDAVRLRLRTDVPLGSCLSGGLDSSSVVALLADAMRAGAVSEAVTGPRQKTFTAYFNAAFDERPYAAQVCEATGAESYQISPSAAEFWEALPALVAAQGEPVAGATVFSQWAVMRLARQTGVTVLLDGQAADELLGGYDNYAALYQAELWRAGRAAAALAQAHRGDRLLSEVGRALYYAAAPGAVQAALRRRRDRAAFAALAPDFAARNAHRRWPAQAGLRRRTLNHRLRADTLQFSLPKLLRYEDRNSMAFSLEARVPFTDYRLVEFALRLPAEFKFRAGWSKWVLRAATVGRVPDAVRWRRDKVGFPAPEGAWLRHGRERIIALLAGPNARVAPYLRVDGMRARIDRALADAHLNHSHLWRWINLEMWLRAQWG
ncbi:MAG: asparagine synthase (glutamine-hydrolyzing) [Anaerolineales bacterium]